MRPMVAPQSASESRTLRRLIWIAFVVVLVTDVGYVLIILAQDSAPGGDSRVVFVAAYIALMAELLGLSLLERPIVVRLRPVLRAGAAVGLLALGTLALMSIGIVLVVAGGLATAAAVMTLTGRRHSALISEGVAGAVALVLLVTGFEVSERLIVCPSRGYMSGSGYGLVSGGYHWTCVDGRLDFRPGFCSSGGGGVDATGHAFAMNSC